MLRSNDVNWFLDPWNEFERMRDIMSRRDARHTSEFPSVNTWMSADDAVVTTEIPGVDPVSIDISVSGRTVTLRGSRAADDIPEDQSFHRRERWSGEFSKAIELPYNIEADTVSAKFSKGVLYLTLPKAEEEKPRKIKIKSN